MYNLESFCIQEIFMVILLRKWRLSFFRDMRQVTNSKFIGMLRHTSLLENTDLFLIIYQPWLEKQRKNSLFYIWTTEG
jgi:hypothetical protein